MSEFNTNETNNEQSTYQTSSTNTNDQNTFDAEVKSTPVQSPKKEKKNHPILTIALCGLVGFGGGALGGYATSSQNSNTNQTVIYKEVTATNTSSSSTSSSSEMTVKEVAEKATPSVVEITVEIQSSSYSYGFYGGSYTSQGAGSGVIISSDGYIITNNHVIEDATSISVTTYDGTSYPATLVGTDEKSDIAVIKIEASDLTPATIGDSSTIAVGDVAVVIGNPLGSLGGTVTDGIISATEREITINNESMNLIQTNAAINSGNSGGGLFDGNGNLVGIVNAKESGTTSSGTTIEGLGFAIPINDAMNVAEQLIESGQVTNRPTIGVTIQTITQDYGNYKAGLYITAITEGSGAEAAGLQIGDKIIGADGTEISSYTELSKVLRNKNVGDILTLSIERDGVEMDVDVILTGALTQITNS